MHTSPPKLPLLGCFSRTWLKRIWPHNTNPPKKKQNIYCDHANNISEMFSVSSSFCYLFWECITFKIWILLKQAFTKRWIRTVQKTLCIKGRDKQKRNIIKQLTYLPYIDRLASQAEPIISCAVIESKIYTRIHCQENGALSSFDHIKVSSIRLVPGERWYWKSIWLAS